MGAIVFSGALGVIGYVRQHFADTATRSGVLPPTGITGLLAVVAVIVFSIALFATHDLAVFS